MLLVAAMAAALAGCGGGGGPAWQTVTADGYRFSAPAGWNVAAQGTRRSATSGPVSLVSVQTFRLVKPYRPDLFASVATELDRAAQAIAKAQDGSVAGSSTARVAGRDAHSYRLDLGKVAEDVTFLLDDDTEYQLLCRRSADATDATCTRFLSSFELEA